MKPRGQRPSGLHVGLAAFVAVLVAMCFLATHASAQDDACGNKCGTDAKCDVAADGTGGKCKCLDGSTFNDVDNTCAGGVV
ncbi:unnamed protein product, partial [Closterium sp. NIES-54]